MMLVYSSLTVVYHFFVNRNYIAFFNTEGKLSLLKRLEKYTLKVYKRIHLKSLACGYYYVMIMKFITV